MDSEKNEDAQKQARICDSWSSFECESKVYIYIFRATFRFPIGVYLRIVRKAYFYRCEIKIYLAVFVLFIYSRDRAQRFFVSEKMISMFLLILSIYIFSQGVALNLNKIIYVFNSLRRLLVEWLSVALLLWWHHAVHLLHPSVHFLLIIFFISRSGSRFLFFIFFLLPSGTSIPVSATPSIA